MSNHDTNKISSHTTKNSGKCKSFKKMKWY